jgi:HAD superfamily hydrolase (TIGR01509 family)
MDRALSLICRIRPSIDAGNRQTDEMVGASGIHWHGNRIDGVVFDVDGTLTDSIRVYYECFREVTAKLGIPVTREDVLGSVALTGSFSLDRAIPFNIPDRDEKIKHLKSLIPQTRDEVLQRVRLLPGVVSVVKTLARNDLILAALTSSRPFALRALHDHSLTPYFKVIITREDAFPQKPEPDGILECTRRMGILPASTLTIGDSPLDIQAGKRAGILTIAVLGGVGS